MKKSDWQRKQARQQQIIKEQAKDIDMHDLLHSIFWGKPTRDQMKEVWARVNEELASRKVNMMRAEIDEAIELGMGSKYR